MKKIGLKTKIEAGLVVCILLTISIGSVMSFTRTITDESDNVDTAIRNSKGNYWEVTASNLQTAIWDLNDTGGNVWLPGDTTFTFSTNLSVEDRVSLIGEGKTTQLTFTGDYTYIINNPTSSPLPRGNIVLKDFYVFLDSTHTGWWMDIHGWDDAYLENITLDGIIVNGNDAAIGNVSGETDRSHSFIKYANNVVVQNCEIYETSGTGLSFQYCNDVYTTDNYLHDLIGDRDDWGVPNGKGGYGDDTSAGFYYLNCNNVMSNNNMFKRTDDNVVGAIGSKNVTISNNIVTDCRHLTIIHDSSDGISTENVVIMGNIVRGADRAIRLGWSASSFECSNVTIIGNDLDATGNYFTGYDAIEFNYYSDNITIMGNRLTANDSTIDNVDTYARNNIIIKDNKGYTENNVIGDLNISGTLNPTLFLIPCFGTPPATVNGQMYMDTGNYSLAVYYSDSWHWHEED